MDQSVLALLSSLLASPQLMAAALVFAFVTKKIVPWWVYEPMAKKLERLEAKEDASEQEFVKFKEEMLKLFGDGNGRI